MGAPNDPPLPDLRAAASFLQRWQETQATLPGTPELFHPAPELDGDTASGDVRVAIVKLTERSHATARTIDEIKTAVDRMQRSVGILVAAQSADDAFGRQVDGTMRSLAQDIAESRKAISTLQKWQSNLQGRTAMIMSVATVLGAVISFGVEYLLK